MGRRVLKTRVVTTPSFFNETADDPATAQPADLRGDDISVPCLSLPVRTEPKDLYSRVKYWDDMADPLAEPSTPSGDFHGVTPPNNLPRSPFDAIEEPGLARSTTASEDALAALDTAQTTGLQNRVPDAATEVDCPPEEIEVDPNGDTLLTLGQGGSAVKLRVQSHIVGAASAVLAEKSRFRSWLKLKAGQLHHLELADEGPCTAPAMKTICEAIHFRSNMDDTVPGARELVEIGTLSERYEFTNALRPWSINWLRQARKRASIPDLKELLIAAQMLDAYTEYSRISFDLIRLHIGPFKYGEGLAPDFLGRGRHRTFGT